MNVGVFFNARRDQGGLYQYAVTLIHCLYTCELQNHYTLFHAAYDPLPLRLDSPRWRVVVLPDHALAWRLAVEVAMMNAARLGWRRPLPALPAYPQMQAERLDVMLYVKPSIHSFLWPFPSVFPIHDLQHLWQPEFPEVSANGESARREFLYCNAVPRAQAILADSEIGREDILRAYSPPPSRVHALPHLAPTYLSSQVSESDVARVQERYAPPAQFLFYPAAFWKHKNHACLLRALRLLGQQHDRRLPLLLAGGKTREYESLAALTSELGLTGQVHFLGYVPDEDIYPLYKLALALVMPTFFGPTNIPYLEAWALGCPVLTSNVRGLPEQVGDAGLLFDPRSEQSIADCIWQVYSNADLRQTLIARGRRKVAAWTPADFARRLEHILSTCLA